MFSISNKKRGGEKVEEILEEIRELSNFVEWKKRMEEQEEAEKEFAEMLRNNTMPYYSAYYSDYLGDDINELKIIIIDSKNEEYECPQKTIERWAANHIEDYEEEGMGITDFTIELIRNGVLPKKFKIIKRTWEEVNREKTKKEYGELEGNLTLEHFEIIKNYLLHSKLFPYTKAFTKTEK